MWFKYLCKLVDLLKRSTLPYAINKDKRTFVAITNCSPRVHRRCMSLMELVLNKI